MTESQRQCLPSWFVRPGTVEYRQATLFPPPLPEVLAELCVSADDLVRWHERGWVSFGKDRIEPLEPWDADEIRFVRDVVRSGLDDAYLNRLFAGLPRPMNFDPDAVAYSFSYGWVAVRPFPEPDPSEIVDEHVEDWLCELAEQEEYDRLRGLRDRIHELLAEGEDSE